MLKQYNGWFGEFSLNPEIDFYGDNYWTRIASKTYEPDTMVFLENHLDSGTDFIDVGAATGGISIIAASLGARVLSFEAVPRVYEIACEHLKNNPDFSHAIDLQNSAISSQTGILQLGENADPRILASISNDPLANATEVKIVSLIEQIELFHASNRRLVVKIDIEGAEWKLLSDKATLNGLRQHSALVLLAIHPGFSRPYKVLPLGLTYFSKKYWQLQNFFVGYLFFKRLLQVATIKRTSTDRIKSAKKCILLMFGGYFEFILDFNEIR